MDDLEYRITKLANIAMDLLNKYKDSEESLAYEFSGYPEIDVREIMDMYTNKRNEIYKLAGWIRYD